MSQELTLLVWSVALTFLQMVVAAGGAVFQLGPFAMIGNRDNLPALRGFAGRAQRAHRNMLESLVPFAVMIVVADITSHENRMTLLGAEIFFWCRCAYAIIYVAGLPWVRTVAWAGSIAGLALIFMQVI